MQLRNFLTFEQIQYCQCTVYVYWPSCVGRLWGYAFQLTSMNLALEVDLHLVGLCLGAGYVKCRHIPTFHRLANRWDKLGYRRVCGCLFLVPVNNLIVLVLDRRYSDMYSCNTLQCTVNCTCQSYECRLALYDYTRVMWLPLLSKLWRTQYMNHLFGSHSTRMRCTCNRYCKVSSQVNGHKTYMKGVHQPLSCPHCTPGAPMQHNHYITHNNPLLPASSKTGESGVNED